MLAVGVVAQVFAHVVAAVSAVTPPVVFLVIVVVLPSAPHIPPCVVVVVVVASSMTATILSVLAPFLLHRHTAPTKSRLVRARWRACPCFAFRRPAWCRLPVDAAEMVGRKSADRGRARHLVIEVDRGEGVVLDLL